MTDPPEPLYQPSKNPARLAAELLQHYSFELAGYSLVRQVEIWMEYYPVEWLPAAITEALYQGRYKAFSVEQILNLWQRRGAPVHHFNHEFERLICSKLSMRDPEPPSAPDEAIATYPQVPLSSSQSLSYRKILLELPSIRAASQLERLGEIPSLRFNQSETGEPASPTPQPPADLANGDRPEDNRGDLDFADLDINNFADALPVSPATDSHGAEMADPPDAAPPPQDRMGDRPPLPERERVELPNLDPPSLGPYRSGRAIPALSPQPANGHRPPLVASPTLADPSFQDFKEGVVFGLSCGLAVVSLHPRIRLELSQRYHPNWLAYLPPNPAIALLQPDTTSGDRSFPLSE